MTEEQTAKIYFFWKSVMPDRRQYKQNSVLLELDDTFVEVKIPINSKYIANAELDKKFDILEPILTPAGMRYCIDELEKVLKEPELPIEKESDWETETKSDIKTDNTKTASADDWAEGAAFDEGDAGKADEELWECNEEGWK